VHELEDLTGDHVFKMTPRFWEVRPDTNVAVVALRDGILTTLTLLINPNIGGLSHYPINHPASNHLSTLLKREDIICPYYRFPKQGRGPDRIDLKATAHQQGRWRLCSENSFEDAAHRVGLCLKLGGLRT
jgi:hypothetical protein